MYPVEFPVEKPAAAPDKGGANQENYMCFLQYAHFGRIAVDLLVVGLAAERHERARHHVHEAPDELLEGGGLAFRGQLAGDAGGDLLKTPSARWA